MIAAVIKELMAAGVTGDALVAAIERIEAEGKPRRSAGAERQARWRERHKASRNVTERNASDASQVTLQASHNVTSNATLSSSSLNLDEGKKEKEKRRGKTLQPEWHPTDSHYRDGELWGLSAADVDGLAEAMRDWAAGNSNRSVAKKADWDATFRGWIRRTAEERGLKKKQPQEHAVPQIGGVWLSEDSAEFDAWERKRISETGKRPPRDRNGGWIFPSQWPPDHHPEQLAAAE